MAKMWAKASREPRANACSGWDTLKAATYLHEETQTLSGIHLFKSRKHLKHGGRAEAGNDLHLE